jgi:hypothetical protein
MKKGNARLLALVTILLVPALVWAQAQPKTKTAPKGMTHILQRQGAVAKDGTVTFEKLPVSPVYAVAFYDKAGLYDGHADPASGSSMGQYGATPNKPDPIKLQAGKPTQVEVKFDDATKTP